MAKVKASEREELESKHRNAAAELAKVEADLAAAKDSHDEACKDLANRQRWLAAATGQNDRLARRLAQSSEWPPDLNKLNAEISALHAKVKESLAKVRELEAAFETARRAELIAHHAVCRFDHREGAVESIRLEILSYHARRKALLASRAAADRCSGVVGVAGPLPVCWRMDQGQIDITEPTSGLCHRVRELVALGYLSGEESFLSEVNWKT